MQITSLLLLGVVGAVTAHPSGHARFHRDLHKNPQRAEGDIITATINGKVVEWTQGASPFQMAGRPQEQSTTATPTPTPTPTPASTKEPAATSSASSSSGDDSGDGVSTYTTFSDYCSSSKKKRATLGQIMYTGNTGEDGNYGCNIIKVASEAVAEKYDNTIKFYGATSDMICYVWNKMAADGTLSGMWGTDATTFTLKAGGVQYVAFDSNTQGAAACYEGSNPVKTSYGALAGTWAEFDFENESNDGWSGFDCSCIVAQEAGLSVPACEMTGGGYTSKVYAGGKVDNAYDLSLKDADGIGGKVSGTLKIEFNANPN